MGGLKEAAFLKIGNCTSVLGLEKRRRAELWQAITTGSYLIYQSCMQAIHGGGKLPDRHAVKLYLQGHSPEMELKPFVRNLPVNPPNTPTGGKQAPKLETLGDVLQFLMPGLQGRKYRALVQGVKVPERTSTSWLVKNACHPDLFLHLAIILDGL